MRHSIYRTMRLDPANWTRRVVYRCPSDPRVVVRSRGPLGWTWNFAHPRVVPAIIAAVVVFLGPPALALWLGVRSPAAIWTLVAAALTVIMLAARYLARDPAE